eukprot:8548835-Pyramimonas_sp.AAC.4
MCSGSVASGMPRNAPCRSPMPLMKRRYSWRSRVLLEGRGSNLETCRCTLDKPIALAEGLRFDSLTH